MIFLDAASIPTSSILVRCLAIPCLCVRDRGRRREQERENARVKSPIWGGIDLSASSCIGWIEDPQRNNFSANPYSRGSKVERGHMSGKSFQWKPPLRLDAGCSVIFAVQQPFNDISFFSRSIEEIPKPSAVRVTPCGKQTTLQHGQGRHKTRVDGGSELQPTMTWCSWVINRQYVSTAAFADNPDDVPKNYGTPVNSQEECCTRNHVYELYQQVYLLRDPKSMRAV